MRGLAAAARDDHCLPYGSFNFTRDAMEIVTKAANADAELPAADLFSLGMSCIKLAAAASESPEAGDRRQAGFLLMLPFDIADAMHKQAASLAAAAAATPAGSSSSSQRSAQDSLADSSSSSSSSSSIGTELAALLWARTLRLVGQGLVAAGGTNAQGQGDVETAEGVPPAEEQCTADQKQFTFSWADSANVCTCGLRLRAEQLLPAVQLPGAAGGEKACAKALEQLQQQCTQLREQVETLNDVLDEAGIGWEAPFYLCKAPSGIGEKLPQRVAAAAMQLGQPLVQFSEALCAQLPVPLCCNNPGCVELRGASEQQLVAGKGSVCSRCRWGAAAEAPPTAAAARGIAVLTSCCRIWFIAGL
jgi:hypothetical protein